MKSLFGDNRLANILEIMRKTSVTDLHVLASQLGVSSRTVRNDIREINDILGDSGMIESDQGRCSLRIFDEEEFHQKYTSILNSEDFMNSSANRRDYIFGRLMRAVTPVLTDDLAYEMNVGKSTLVKDLTRLRQEIASWGLTIKGVTSKGLMLSGEEISIRQYVLDNNYENIFRDYPQDEVVAACEEQTFEALKVEAGVEEEIDRYMTLMLDRFMTGHYIGRLPDQYYNLTSRRTFPLFDHMINKLSSRLHIEIPIEEKIFVFLPIAGMRKPDDVEKMSQIELDESMRPLLKKIISTVSLEMGIEIELGSYEEEFLYHLMFMINRMRYSVHIDNPMADEVRSKYPVAARIADIAARVIEKECRVTVSREELGYLTSYFSVFMTSSMNREPGRYAVVYGAGKVTARLIGMQLRKIIDSTAVVDFYPVDNVSANILDGYDIVLTTVDLPEDTIAPVIYIREVFDEAELQNRIRKLRYLPQGKNRQIDDNWFVMNSLLDADHFFQLDEYESYEEAMHEMIASLVKKGELDEGFEQRLREREDKATMAVGNGFAIPHTINKASQSIVLAFGVFSEPIRYQNMNISVIVLIALPEKSSNDELLVRIYDEIIAIMNDQELFSRITSARSFPALMRALYRRV